MRFADFADRESSVVRITTEKQRRCDMIRQRFLPFVLALVSGVGLFLASASPAHAWGGRWGYGYWGGPYYGWTWGYPYAGYYGYGYSPYSYYPYSWWGYGGSPYATLYQPSYYYPSLATYAYGPAYPATVQTTSYYPPSAPDNSVYLTVEVPSPAAQVWIEGQQMRQDGTVRTFESPPLEPGYAYTYTLRARWQGNGGTRDQTQTVRVRAGRNAVVRFGS
jgi:uncharacterized protein (TIGR03000 family)